MQPSTEQLCREFSQGNFPFCYDYFTADIEWKIVGSNTVKGKHEVVTSCDRMMKDMTASALNNTNVISGNDCFVIEGSCTFSKAGNQTGELCYCDVYKTGNGQIAAITSYCIDVP